MDDPQVLTYWRDWLHVRSSAALTGWSFARYVAARIQALGTVTSIVGSNTGGPANMVTKRRYLIGEHGPERIF